MGINELFFIGGSTPRDSFDDILDGSITTYFIKRERSNFNKIFLDLVNATNFEVIPEWDNSMFQQELGNSAILWLKNCASFLCKYTNGIAWTITTEKQVGLVRFYFRAYFVQDNQVVGFRKHTIWMENTDVIPADLYTSLAMFLRVNIRDYSYLLNFDADSHWGMHEGFPYLFEWKIEDK